MENKRKALFISAAALLVMLLAFGATSAFFTTEGTAQNVVTTGGIDIELNEFADTGNGLVDFKDVSGVMPGGEASKIVVAENVGSHPAYVKMKVTFDTGVKDKDPSEAISLNYNKESWIYKDGFYYYEKELKPGESTEPLFTTVYFAENMDNSWQNARIKINVSVYGVQSENNGKTALDAGGWPE